MKSYKFNVKPKHTSPIDQAYYPIILALRAFDQEVIKTHNYEKVVIGIRRSDDELSTYHMNVFHEDHEDYETNMFFIERIIKTLLWLKGGYHILFQGPQKLGEHIKHVFSHKGLRDFDVRFMERIYEQPFDVTIIPKTDILIESEKPQDVGRHLDGYRIGFDAGGSDRKVSAVMHGETVFSEEVVWHPKLNSDPMYHIKGIKDSLLRAASHLPRVDAIGVSSAGVYVDNQARVASLFIKVPDDAYEKHIKNIYIDIAKDMGNIPITVANDGDVTALAGAMSLKQHNVLGIAMGTSQAAGYVNHQGYLTGWLNELAFAPVDVSPDAPQEDWSKDFGCGSLYFSQDAIIRLAVLSHIEIDHDLSPAEKLLVIQELAKQKDYRALDIFKTIGIYLGYSLAYYHEFYHMKNVLILGRVTSGIGGELIIKEAKKVLKDEFQDIYENLHIQLPDEISRRVGQSIAAASLTKI